MLLKGLYHNFHLRIAVFVAGIKGQVMDFFIGVLGIVGIVLQKFVRCGIGDRRLPLLLEA